MVDSKKTKLPKTIKIPRIVAKKAQANLNLDRFVGDNGVSQCGDDGVSQCGDNETFED